MTEYPNNEKQFVRVCSLRQIPRRAGKRVVFDDETEVALFRIDGVVYAVSNICPHQHEAVIAEGYVEDCTVTCPLHARTYDLQTGKSVAGEADLRTYQVKVEGEDVFVEKPPAEVPRWMKW